MLTRKQISLLDEKGISTLHDFRINSLIAGEPFMQDGVLSYFDGRLVTVCGFPLRGEGVIEQNTLRNLSKYWITKRSAEGIIYIGSQSLDLRCLRASGLRRDERFKGQDFSAELVIKCNGSSEEISKHRFYRRACSRGFESTVKTGGILSAEHLKLIERFYSLREITCYLAEMAFALPAVLRSKRVSLIEARQNGRLCGFLALHECFKDMLVALFLYHDHQTPGVSDFLYGEMLRYARRFGAATVNVGPSPTRGHYNFKLKWGGESAVPPYYLVGWMRGRLRLRSHKSWGPRLVRL
jgi:hypothetical protein